ncbi:hypothetical protein JOF41_007318 [Saccharothrix coeruleofusca]|uniref:hypothetical protein n=1 Tax=Saccharothrix coeruleofusca TaxID=33919 RepID=UPI001AE96204|nr:hypothetical protein [Saccharothrix coeruleofusca]MBP2341064.1 hypothetical protein [Saccharothrix coeruleofusca]
MTVYDLAPFAEDGVRPDSPTQQWRFPIISHPYPRWNYITALVVHDHEALWTAVMPSDAELAVVASFHDEYMTRWYNPGYRARMADKYPFDVDGGANGRYLLKVADGNWKYRKRTWDHGPWPFRDDEPMDLLPLLDRIHTIGGEPMPHWTEWKSRHADVFAAVTR